MNPEVSEVDDGGIFTEEFAVTKEDVSFQSSEDPGHGQESQMTSCSCREEIESLKNTLKQLTLQVDKQNLVIGGIKSSLRNAVLSLMTCCREDEQDEESLVRDEGHNVQESPVIVNAFSKSSPSAFAPLAEDPLLIEIGNSSVQISGASPCQSPVTREASSNEAGFLADQSPGDQEDATMDDEDDKADAEVDDNDDDSSYVPDDDDDTEDIHHHLQGNQLKSAKLVTKANRKCSRRSTKSIVNSEGSFQCSKCGKNFMSKKSLNFHIRSLHSKNGPLFECHLCPKAFSYRGILANHISSIHERVEHKCEYCPGKFNDLSNLKRHKKSVHMKGGPPTQQCGICGIHLVKSELSLGVHMAKVHNKSRTKPLPKKKRLVVAPQPESWKH